MFRIIKYEQLKKLCPIPPNKAKILSHEFDIGNLSDTSFNIYMYICPSIRHVPIHFFF